MQAHAGPSSFDRFLDLFERHKYGIIGTLLLHTLLLFTLAMSRFGGREERENLTEAQLDVLPPMTDEEFTGVEQRVLQGGTVTDLKSMVSNVTAEKTASTWPSRATQERMAQQLEHDLKAMEQAEFDRLAQERHEKGEDVVVPELDPTKWNKELYMQKAAEPVKVQGNAAVWHDLKDRVESRLDIPAYTCRGSGEVVVKVAVGRDGMVRRHELDAAGTTTSDACMIERALASAAVARFNFSGSSPDPQRGSIHYVFVAQ